MTNPQTSNELSHFESLPPEIMNAVLKELLDVSTHPASTFHYRPDDPWSTSVYYKPGFDTGILRTNKRLHTISKSYLDRANKWVIFHIEDVCLLTPWTNGIVPVTLIDPDAEYALPQGIMQVHVKLCVYGPRAINTSRCFPLAYPQRQVVLVQLQHFELFLNQLRIMELMYGVRVMPGMEFSNADHHQVTAVRGFHGLKLRVVVDSGYPEHLMRPLLEFFRMFHGPLNEVSILGAADDQQARNIETSIALPRDAQELTMHEMTTHIIRLHKFARSFVTTGSTNLAFQAYSRVRQLVDNWLRSDQTPWSGWNNTPRAQMKFELCLLCTASLNSLLLSIADRCEFRYDSIETAMYLGVPPGVLTLSHLHGLSREMIGWISLTVGLHFILNAEIGITDVNGLGRLVLIRQGMGLVEGTIGFFEHLPPNDIVLFREALDMCTSLRRIDSEPDKSLLFLVIDNFHTKFVDLITKHDRFVRWAVHESIVPQAVIDRGAVEYMTPYYGMTGEEKERSIFVNVFVVEEENGGWYCF